MQEQLQLSRTLIGLGLTWALIAILAWSTQTLQGLSVSAEPIDANSTDPGSVLCVLSLVLAAIGFQLRLPLHFGKMESASTEFVYLLGLLGAINWCGYFLICSANTLQALPAILVLAVVEIYLAVSLGNAGQIPLLRQKSAGILKIAIRLSNQLYLRFRQAAGNIEDSQVLDQMEVKPKDQFEESLQSEMRGLAPEHNAVEESYCEGASEFQRTCNSGLDENGNIYLVGTMQIELDQDQQQLEISQWFSPGFDSKPAVELELLDERVRAKVKQLSPLGMRILISRIPSTVEAVHCDLEWYAVCHEQAEQSALP
ncbi:MAG: hypothetical protein AAF483_17600 [Planctomycetota bacterium]